MSDNLPAYLLALSAGFFYSISAVLCKRGLELGAGTLRSLIFSNLVMSLCFVPYPFFAEIELSVRDLLTGSCLGFLFFSAQFFCFLALREGDASLMTPIMGSKPIFVALFLMLTGLSTQAPSIETWIAAILATFAVALIGWPSSKSRTSYRGLILALCAAAGFGLLDSLVPHFTHKSDPFNILFCVFGTVGAFSLFLIPWSEGKLIPYRPASDLWMWASAFPMGAQAVLMSMAIGLYRVPTEANVFYSCRGLWAVLLVACLGKAIGLKEGKSHSSIFLRRLIGATALALGVWLIGK